MRIFQRSSHMPKSTKALAMTVEVMRRVFIHLVMPSRAKIRNRTNAINNPV